MSDIFERLDKVEEKISTEAFLSNKGLSNEVGIHVFCYDPSDEMIVSSFFNKLATKKDVNYNLKTYDLYSIFIEICAEKKILDKIPSLEETKGRDIMKAKVLNVATPEFFVKKMLYEPHMHGDIVLITGVGKIYPYMRAHSILKSIQAHFSDIPVLLLFPGKYDGNSLTIFGKVEDGNHYRAFNLI